MANWHRSDELESMLEGIPSLSVAAASVASYPYGPRGEVGPECLYAVRVASEDDPSVSVFLFRSLDEAEAGLQGQSDERL